MKPFSPLYFIRENKLKCIMLIFMLFLGYGAYLGGLYVASPHKAFDLISDYYDRLAAFTLIGDDYNEENVALIKNDISEYEGVELLQLGTYQSFTWKTVMGFNSGDASFCFRSAEDFMTYCEFSGIEYDFGELKKGDMVMSDIFAKNCGLKTGDTVDEDFSEDLSTEFTLRATTGENGYMQYFILGEDDYSEDFLLLGKSGKELHGIVRELQKKYDIYLCDDFRRIISDQYKTFDLIYIFIIILLSVILAVTINAAFVGMYQRRNFEFAVYRAIGFTRRQIISKIVGELLCMDLIALTAGGAVFFFGLYLFNNLSLYPIGLRLDYFHPLALTGLLVCDLAVVIPLTVTRCRQLLKADICEY